jgi:branched-chain amino acid transport system permease protein
MTGGAQGILQVPDPSIGVELPFIGGPELSGPQSLYYVIVLTCIGAAFVSVRLQDSRVGRSWAAMREDEQVAEAMGISIIKTKLLAFVMGATIGSFSGMLFAVKIGSIFPHSFALLVSIAVLSIVVLGGMGSIPGVLAGAFVLIGLPEMLREFAEYRLLIYGAILVGIMLLKPEGLIPSARRQLELHEEEYEQEQYEKRHGPKDEGAPVVAAGPGGDST